MNAGITAAGERFGGRTDVDHASRYRELEGIDVGA